MPIENIANSLTKNVNRATNLQNIGQQMQTDPLGAIGAILQPGSTMGSYTFGNLGQIGKIINSTKKAGNKIKCGYAADTSGPVGENYLISIENNDWIVGAVMQDTLALRVESAWKPLEDLAPPEAKRYGDIANAISQALAKRSLLTSYTSRRIWAGTSPVEMNITLRFEAVYDAYSEVVEPCMALQMMALPTTGTGNLFGLNANLPLLAPPGPSPYQLEGTPAESVKDNKVARYMAQGDNISISMGALLYFNNIIIHAVTVTFDTRITEQGHPISAKVDIVFQTYEILTKKGLADAYRAKE